MSEKFNQHDTLSGDCALLTLMIAQLERWDFSDQDSLSEREHAVVLDAQKRMTENLKGQLTFKKKMLER